MYRLRSLLYLLLALVAPALCAQILDQDQLALDNDSVGTWFDHDRREAIEAAIDFDAGLGSLLGEARHRIDSVLTSDGASCEKPNGESVRRACNFASNVTAYERFLRSNQACRAGRVLDNVTSPSVSADAVVSATSDATATLGESDLASMDRFTPARIASQFLLFEETLVPADCADGNDLRLVTIVIPQASNSVTDKIVLAYSFALSLRTWDYNRPNAEVTAELIRHANERWSRFETNVVLDQYPWETLLFNDWLAGVSPRFRGTLTHPPTQQIRALHPLPTAILDVSGGDTLFRPRLTIEVLGLRWLEETSYTPKRAVSVIATLKAEAGESNGWGMLYTWKRGSLGIVYQENAFQDDVIGLVFGIDLANQIESRRNNVMEEWRSLRRQIGKVGELLP